MQDINLSYQFYALIENNKTKPTIEYVFIILIHWKISPLLFFFCNKENRRKNLIVPFHHKTTYVYLCCFFDAGFKKKQKKKQLICLRSLVQNIQTHSPPNFDVLELLAFISKLIVKLLNFNIQCSCKIHTIFRGWHSISFYILSLSLSKIKNIFKIFG